MKEFSAFVKDLKFSELPAGTRKDVLRFVKAKADTKFCHYGMCPKELAGKADTINFKEAKKHAAELSEEQARKHVEKHRESKYVLLLNDKIVDGHHHLAKALRGNVSNSVHALDLTPARFQLERGMIPKTTEFVSAAGGTMPGPVIIVQPRKRDRLSRLKDATEITAASLGGAAAYHAIKNAPKVGAAADELRSTLHGARRFYGHGNVAKRKVARGLRGLFALAAKLEATEFATTPYLTEKQKREKSLLHLTETKKKIRNEDLDRGEANYAKSAAAGAVAGAAIAHHKFPTHKAAGIGAIAGLLAQGLIRRSTETTKDEYGERSRTAKKAEKIPIAAGIGLAGASVLHRLRKHFSAEEAGAIEFAVSPYLRTAAGKIARTLKNRPGLVAGLSLAGGITAADTVSAVSEADDEKKREAARRGLRRGLLYGGVLAATEPVISRGLHRVAQFSAKEPTGLKNILDLLARGRVKKSDPAVREARDKAAKFLRKVRKEKPPTQVLEAAFDTLRAFARKRNYEHHSDWEARESRGGKGAGQFKSSLSSYVDRKKNYHGDTLSLTDQPVVRSAYRKASTLNRYGTRGLRLHGDLSGALRGERKVDSRGRPIKREWERTWFRNAVVNTALTGGVLAGAAIARRNPGLRHEIASSVTGGRAKTSIGKQVSKISRSVQEETPDILHRVRRKAKGLLDIDRHFKLSAGPRREVLFYNYAPDWDVRDQRGRSARVYHEGNYGPRNRRPAYWHEKKKNRDLIGAIAATTALLGGGAAGLVIGRRFPKSPIKSARGLVREAKKIAKKPPTELARGDVLLRNLTKNPRYRKIGFKHNPTSEAMLRRDKGALLRTMRPESKLEKFLPGKKLFPSHEELHIEGAARGRNAMAATIRAHRRKGGSNPLRDFLAAGKGFFHGG